MKARSLLIVGLVVAAASLAGCKKGGGAALSAKAKTILGSWEYQAEKTQTAALTKAGTATGIKNLKDIKLKGDVKKMVGAFTAKKLRFTKVKKTGDLVYQITRGKGLLKSQKTAYWQINSDATQVTLFKLGTKEKAGGKTYTVETLTADTLVLVNNETKLKSHYKRL